MNITSHFKPYLFTVVLSVAATAVQAHQFTMIDGHESRNSAPAAAAGAAMQPGVSRAEVLADLQLYRESGFAELDRADVPAWESPAYKEAAARYAALRASPRYAELVRQYGGAEGSQSLARSSH